MEIPLDLSLKQKMLRVTPHKLRKGTATVQSIALVPAFVEFSDISIGVDLPEAFGGANAAEKWDVGEEVGFCGFDSREGWGCFSRDLRRVSHCDPPE